MLNAVDNVVYNRACGRLLARTLAVEHNLTCLVAFNHYRIENAVNPRKNTVAANKCGTYRGGDFAVRELFRSSDKLDNIAEIVRRFNVVKGIESKFDGRGNYTVGIQEQIIFPEINIDSVNKMMGMNITFVTSAPTDEEGYALLKEFGLPFKNAK